jgi:hypothetical protein
MKVLKRVAANGLPRDLTLSAAPARSEVTATDEVGNSDPSAARDKFKAVV